MWLALASASTTVGIPVKLVTQSVLLQVSSMCMMCKMMIAHLQQQHGLASIPTCTLVV